MVKYYTTMDSTSLNEIPEITKGCWIYLETPTAGEILQISVQTGIPKPILEVALDEEEQARIENGKGNFLAVIDIPKETEKDGKKIIETFPMAIITTENYFVTVCTRQTSVLDDLISCKISNIATSKQSKLLYQVLYNTFTRYLFYLKKIDKMGSGLQKNMSKSMENKELLELVELQKALVFFSASLSANHSVVQKIINSSISKNTAEEKEILEDVLIEVRQAIEMCTIYREIIKNSMDAFSSIVNNNMNIIMKFLTAITIILSIPMIIAGFWGMNTGVPWGGLDYGFWIVIGISIIFSIVLLIYFLRKKML